jgi:formiminotetrahydrofolate cyclodeaminase
MEFNYLKESLKDYIDRLSEKTPCPGGGSASILSVAIASSLVCMVANYTLGSKLVKEESQNIVKNILKDAAELKETLSPLIEKDSYIYEKIRSVYKSVLKESSYIQQYEERLKESIDLHFEILNNCFIITEWNQLLVIHGNPNLISDVAVSSSLILGGIKATKINILINLKEVRNREYVNNCVKKMEEIILKTQEKAEEIIEKIETKIKGDSDGR